MDSIKKKMNVCFTTTKEQYEDLVLIQRCMSIVDRKKYSLGEVLRAICITGLKEANPEAWKLYSDIIGGRYGGEGEDDEEEKTEEIAEAADEAEE